MLFSVRCLDGEVTGVSLHSTFIMDRWVVASTAGLCGWMVLTHDDCHSYNNERRLSADRSDAIGRCRQAAPLSRQRSESVPGSRSCLRTTISTGHFIIISLSYFLVIKMSLLSIYVYYGLFSLYFSYPLIKVTIAYADLAMESGKTAAKHPIWLEALDRAIFGQYQHREKRQY